MKRSMRLFYFAPFLFHEARSGYLRERSINGANDGADDASPCSRTRILTGLRNAGGSSNSSVISPSSVHRVLPLHQDAYEYHECSSKIVKFEAVVFIEFNRDLSNLTDSERQSLENAVLTTYNHLSSVNCDLPYHRSIANVTLEWPPTRRQKQSEPNFQDPLTFFVSASDASNQKPQSHPPKNYTNDLNATLISSQDPFTVFVNGSNASNPNPQSRPQKNITSDMIGNDDTIEEENATLIYDQDLFTVFVNPPNASDANPQSRPPKNYSNDLIGDDDAMIDDPFTVLANASDQNPQLHPPKDNTNGLIGNDETMGEENAQQTYKDTARFFINVECRDCPANTTLFSLGLTPMPPSTIHGAIVSIGEERIEEPGGDSCACLVHDGSKEVASNRAPTADEFLASFNQTVVELNENGVLQDLDRVLDLAEVDVVNCSSNVKQFSSSVIANLQGNVELMTQAERLALEQGFLETYNSLTFARCDRYFRQIRKVKLISALDRRVLLEEHWDDDSLSEEMDYNTTIRTNGNKTNSTSTPAVYRVLGECRDCYISQSGSFDLFDDGFRRDLSQSWMVSPFPRLPIRHEHNRRLLEDTDDVCYCPANEEPTDSQAPSDKEFEAQYNTKVEGLKKEGVIVHVSAVEDVSNDEDICNMELELVTNHYVISFDRVLKGVSLYQKLMDIFRDAYRTLVRDVCGPLLADVRVIDSDEENLEVIVEVDSVQTLPGSIFFDGIEEAIFLSAFNVLLSEKRIIAEAESIRLRAQPSAAPSSVPWSLPTSSTNSTSKPNRQTDPTEDKGLENQAPTTKPPTMDAPNSAPTTDAPITSSPSTPAPAIVILRPLRLPTTAPTQMPTEGLNELLPLPVPTVEPTPAPTVPPIAAQSSPPTAESSTQKPTAGPNDTESTGKITPAPGTESTGKITPAPGTTEPSVAPTSDFDKVVGDLDKAVSDIIKDVGETLEDILGAVFPIVSDVTGFLDEVENALENISGAVVDLDIVPDLLNHISERVEELSKISWLPQMPKTYQQIQDSIGALLGLLVPDSPTTSPKEVEQNTLTTPSPTTQLDKQMEEANKLISGIVEDVGETLESIVGHVVEASSDVSKFLDDVDGLLEELAGGPLPDLSDLPDLLENISEQINKLSELPFLPDLPLTTEKIKGTIQGILQLWRGTPGTESPAATPTTRAPTQRPTPMPTTQKPTYKPTQGATNRATTPKAESGPAKNGSKVTVTPKETVAPAQATTIAPQTLLAAFPPSQAPTLSPADCGTATKGTKPKGGEKCTSPTPPTTTPTTVAPTSRPTNKSIMMQQFEYLNDTSTLTEGTSDPPTKPPTMSPIIAPTMTTTKFPTVSPSNAPTFPPTEQPTTPPTESPSDAPTMPPTEQPTKAPTQAPSPYPTEQPTGHPTQELTPAPTPHPTYEPTQEPTLIPTSEPTNPPTMGPTPVLTHEST